MPLHTILIKPASGMCNMQCDYCFYCDEAARRETGSYGMMSEQTLKNLVRKALFQAEREICFAFQGGEPTLRGLDFFRKAVEYENRFNRNGVHVMNTLQTNGYALNEDWCRFFKENNFLIGVSVDGTEEIHNRYRHNRQGKETYSRIRDNISMLEKYGVEYNILTVVTARTAENIREIYQDYKKNGWGYQQYIICLDPLDETPGQREYSLTPQKYGEFLTELFRLWDRDWKKGKAPYIRQFENYVGILLGYPPEACEQRGTCSVQCVAEADGSAYPCDFYALDEYRLGNYNNDRIPEMVLSGTARKFVEESQKISEKCRDCEWYSLCRGGCRRRRIREKESGLYRDYFCEGYRYFFSHCGNRLREIAEYLR